MTVAENRDACDDFVQFGSAAVKAALDAAQFPWPEAPPIDAYYGGDEGATGEAQSDGESVFELLSLAELRQLPPPEWLVHEAIVSDGLSIIYGEPGAGKSFIALDMALRIALGWDWHGVRTKQTGVLYIAGEGVRGIGKRVDGWAQAHKTNLDDAPFVFMPIAAQLLEESEKRKLCRTIDEAKRKIGFDIGLIVVDTVSRSIAGSDENGQETMSAFVKACDDIKHYAGGALIGIHHSGKDKERGMRGSTVLLGACDAAIRLSKDDGRVTLDFEKQKDAEEARPIHFALEKYVWNTGTPDEPRDDFSTLIPVLEAKSEIEGTGINRAQIRSAFGMMIDAWTAARALSHRPETRRDGRFAPALFAKKIGGKEGDWTSLITSWLENGNLSFEEFDRRNKTRGLRVLEAVL